MGRCPLNALAQSEARTESLLGKSQNFRSRASGGDRCFP
jgi:hypothetical protein